jgi:hypothetical protein
LAKSLFVHFLPRSAKIKFTFLKLVIGLHYTAWALVKTVEHSTIQLSLVCISYCIIPYIVYCFGLALCQTKPESYMSTVTHKSSSIHLSLTPLFISCHSLYSNIYHISYTVKKLYKICTKLLVLRAGHVYMMQSTLKLLFI